MGAEAQMEPHSGLSPEHFDVLIIGAGISGIDAAYHLSRNCPNKHYALLDTQSDFGGTWRTHTYPGIRSDSDLYTFGYKWKPWKGPPIATAEQILAYLDEALDEQDIRRHIRFGHTVLEAAWDGTSKRWVLRVEQAGNSEPVMMSCTFLWMCQGYYRHAEGYTPDFPGMERFGGRIVHPQTWPDDLDYQGKRVVVIGSGATAATLIPAIADDCAHVTMLQRSPTYYYAKPNVSELAELLRPLDLPDEWFHEIVRRRYLHDQKEVTRRSFEEPEVLRAELLEGAQAYLGPDYPLDPHFTPSYRPWRQRLAALPDGDLFRSIAAGKASVVTDHIVTFTETGIELTSGRHLDTDIIITATGFNLLPLGDIAFTIDGKPLDIAECWAHRGILFSGVPNMAWVFGYLRTSWTMRADLVCEFVCRLLNQMEQRNAVVVTPQLRDEDRDMPERPFIDPENFNAGYLTRSMQLMPKQGDRQPWIFSQDYYSEKDQIEGADLEDGTLQYD